MAAVHKSLITDPRPPEPLTDEQRAEMERDLDLCLETLRTYRGRVRTIRDAGWAKILRYQIRVLAKYVRWYREQLAR